jgi:hypothetical protein
MPVPHKLTRRLQETLGSEAGDAMVDWLNNSDADRDELRHELGDFRQSTRADFAEVRQEMRAQAADLRQEMAALSGELRQEMAALGGELRQEMAALGGELRQEMAALGGELRLEMRVGFAHVDAKFAASEAAAAKRHEEFMRWTLGFWVVSLATVIGALIGFSRFMR